MKPPEIRKKIETLTRLWGALRLPSRRCAASPWIRRAGHQELVLALEPTEAPIMAECLDHREKKLAQIARAARGPPAQSGKGALGFGGGFANWTSKVLQDKPLASNEGEQGLRRRGTGREVADGEDGGGSGQNLQRPPDRGPAPEAVTSRGCQGGRAQAGGPVGMRGGKPGLCEAGPVVHVPVEGVEDHLQKLRLVRLGQTVEDLMCKMCCPVFKTIRTTCRRPLNDNAFFKRVLRSLPTAWASTQRQ